MSRISNKSEALYCFLDTNILIEFQTFNEVDWPKVLNAKQVYLVLAPIVFRELDKHKSNYADTRRRRRARMLVSKLTKLFEEVGPGEAVQVRPNVTLQMIPREPFLGWKIEDWIAEGFDQNDPDDRLLASILDFSREYPLKQVLLLSDDSGPRFKAPSHNIIAKAPPDELIHHLEPPTPEEVTIKELNEKLAVFTNRMPKLRLGFWENGEVVDEITRPINKAWRWQTLEEYVQEEMDEKREVLKRVLSQADDKVRKDEVQKFTVEYEKYLKSLESALKMKFIKVSCPYSKLELTVLNDGTATASGVDVQFIFPEGSSIVTIDDLDTDITIEDDMPKEPTIPEWARPPMPELLKNIPYSSLTSITNAVNALNSFNSIGYSLNLPVNFLSPKAARNSYFFEIFPFHRNILEQRAEQIGHHRRMVMKPMIVYLPANTQTGFSINYSVLMEEVPSPISGELKLRWE